MYRKHNVYNQTLTSLFVSINLLVIIDKKIDKNPIALLDQNDKVSISNDLDILIYRNWQYNLSNTN